MKKTRIILSVIFLTGCLISNAQLSQVTVQNGSNIAFYADVKSAVNNASSGDTIYIPGGIFELNSNLDIDKRIHIIGVGHYPDSTEATNYTRLEGYVRFFTGADTSSIEGCYITYDIRFGTSGSNDDIKNITINRCNVQDIYLSYTGSATSESENTLINECVVRGNIFAANTDNQIISKSIINNFIDYLSNSYVTNCIFLYVGSNNSVFGRYHPQFIVSSLFENNIIFDSYPLGGSSNNNQNCMFNNNLFVYDQSFPYGTNVGSNNIVNFPQEDIFINQTGNAFSYDHNYHLQPTCPGVGAGTDGTNIGIYGTDLPYKEGAVPCNPHIQTQNVTYDKNTNTLSVDVKVSAQDR